MISTTLAFITVTILSLGGLGFAIFVAIRNKLKDSLDEQLDKYLLTSKEGIPETEFLQSETPGLSGSNDVTRSLKLYYKGIAQQVHSCSIELFKTQTIMMLFFALVFALGFLIWLAEEDKAGLLTIAFALGCACAIFSTLLTLEISIASVVRTAILSLDESVLGFSFLNSAAISVATTSLSLLTLSILIASYISALGDETTTEVYFSIFQSILGFGLGVAFGSIFYREAGGMSAKGILVGKDMISKSNYQNYDQTVIEVNLNTASIISNIYNNNVISVLDFQTAFAAFLCVYLLVLSQSTEIIESNHATFYLPLILIGTNMIVAAGVSFITLSSPAEIPSDSSVPGETAKQVRLQVLICNAVSIVFIILLPIFFVPSFSMGSEKNGDLKTVTHSDIGASDAIWAMLAGLGAQTLLIVYSEIFTSHYYSFTQNIAAVKDKHEKGSFSLTMITATLYAHISQLGIFSIFAFIIILGYLLCGLFGIACSILGLLSAPFSLMSINMFAGFTAESFDISGIGYLRRMRAKLFSYSWAARNFSIYTQIVTLMGVLLTNFLCLGVSVFVTKKYNVYVWDAYGIFGFLYGGSLAYFIKGIGIQGILKVAENLKEGYLGKSTLNDFKSNLREVGNLVKGQFQSVVLKVAINIFVSIGSIVIIGVLFGLECLVAFAFGLNLIGVFLCFNSLIIGYSVKNAREYNRNYGKVSDVDDAPVQTDIMVTASEGIPGTALVTYLIFFTLFFLQGAPKFAKYGFFRQWVKEGEFNTLANDATDEYIKSVKGVFDGEDGEQE